MLSNLWLLSHPTISLICLVCSNLLRPFESFVVGTGILFCFILAIAIFCLCQMNVLENRFSAIIRQSQQSTIATALLRSPLNCCDSSSLVVGKMAVVELRALRALRRYRIGFDRKSYFILSSPIEGVSPNPI